MHFFVWVGQFLLESGPLLWQRAMVEFGREDGGDRRY